eukprot:Hpha_TRINITY_DN16962_c2_g5::TRINITY_DN16962_c2_g5_i1::g.54161::m.54161
MVLVYRWPDAIALSSEAEAFLEAALLTGANVLGDLNIDPSDPGDPQRLCGLISSFGLKQVAPFSTVASGRVIDHVWSPSPRRVCRAPQLDGASDHGAMVLILRRPLPLPPPQVCKVVHWRLHGDPPPLPRRSCVFRTYSARARAHSLRPTSGAALRRLWTVTRSSGRTGARSPRAITSTPGGGPFSALVTFPIVHTL